MCRMLKDEVVCHSSANEDSGKMEEENRAELLMVIFIDYMGRWLGITSCSCDNSMRSMYTKHLTQFDPNHD